jgi:hypothetical protein
MSLRAALLLMLSLAASACADVRTVAQWRLGEGDPKAAPNTAAADPTKDSIGKLDLQRTGAPTYVADVSDQAKDSKLAVRFNGKDTRYSRTGLFDARDNFGAEAFVCARNEEGFHVVLQYGSGSHGWSLVRNAKGFQVLLGGVALVGWSGDQPANQWVHVAVVRDSGKTTFYFNGRPMGSSDAKLNDADDKAEFSIGAATGGKDQFLDGDVDEVRVFTFEPGTFDASQLLMNRSTTPPSSSK